jgi:hypothetical protein
MDDDIKMLIFLTIMFIAIYTAALIKGGFLKDVHISLGESAIKIAQGEKETAVYSSDQVLTALLKTVLIAIPLFLLQLLYYIFALDNDPYTYPTLTFMIYTVSALTYGIIKRNKKPNLNNEEDIVAYRKKLYKGRTIRGTLLTVLHLSYFLYMFYVLILK